VFSKACVLRLCLFFLRQRISHFPAFHSANALYIGDVQINGSRAEANSVILLATAASHRAFIAGKRLKDLKHAGMASAPSLKTVRFFPAYSALAFVAVLAACGGPVNTVPIATASASPAPTATATASPTPGPLSVTPTTLSFTAAGLVQSLTVGDPSYSGAYTISGCAGVVALGSVVSGSLSVTSVAAGSCTLTIGDSFSHQTAVSVSVNTLTVPVI
jgi:hypothetical protein